MHNLHLFLADNKKIRDLRRFPEAHLWKFKTADSNKYLCSACRNGVAKYKPPSEANTLDMQSLSQELAAVLSYPSTSSLQQSSSSDWTEDHSIENFLKLSPIQRKKLVEYFDK